MSNISEHIKKIKPYPLVPHEVWNNLDKIGFMKLDWNESCSNIYLDTIKDKYEDKVFKNLNLYPTVKDYKIIKLLSEYVNTSEKNILYTNGSDRALEYITKVFLKYDDKVGIISPTYDNFRIYVESIGSKVVNLKPKNIFSKDLEFEMVNDLKLVYIVNPNNPTGWFISEKEIIRLLEKYPNTQFLIDEAYIEFYGEDKSFSKLCEKYSNICITRTFSKAFGLAGIRFGYIISNSKNIVEFEKIVNPKEISSFSLNCAKIALENLDIMRNQVKSVKIGKKKILEFFGKSKYIKEVYDTPGNFLLIKLDEEYKAEFINKLEKNHIYIRNLSHLETLKDYFRLTAPNEINSKKLIEKIK